MNLAKIIIARVTNYFHVEYNTHTDNTNLSNEEHLDDTFRNVDRIYITLLDESDVSICNQQYYCACVTWLNSNQLF